jgi:hypothetical protein
MKTSRLGSDSFNDAVSTLQMLFSFECNKVLILFVEMKAS